MKKPTTIKPTLPALSRPPAGPPARTGDRSQPGKVTGRLRAAILEMVWKGASRADSAAAAGMTDHSLRTALRKPHVKRFYLDEIRILRTSELAKNVHALADVRDRSENPMARVAAVKALEAQVVVDNSQGDTAPMMPGIVIVIGNTDRQQAPAAPMITVSPTRVDEAD